ncbi:MAG: LuxR family transcriptional regulator [Pseudomonadota bacterium]
MADLHHLTTFIRTQAAARDVETLWDAITVYLAAHTLPMVSYHHHAPGFGGAAAITLKSQGFPDAWVRHYIEKKLYRIDPITDYAMRSTRPFFWSEVRTLASLMPDQQGYLQELEAAGIGDGLAVQVFGPRLRHGYFGLGFGGDRRDLPTELVGDLQVVCQMAHLRYCDLMPPPEPETLSPREREVLEWIARGKSNAAIGRILDVSSHTVDAYLRRIFAKLEVGDRTSAAIRGIGAGLIRGEL